MMYSVTIIMVGPDNEETVGETDILAGKLDYQMTKMLTEWATNHGLDSAVPIAELISRMKREF